MATTINSRDFIRDFARLKRTAANGDEIIVRDRKGQSFIFRAKSLGPSLAEQLSDLRGALSSGTRIKDLNGFGRNRS